MSPLNFAARHAVRRRALLPLPLPLLGALLIFLAGCEREPATSQPAGPDAVRLLEPTAKQPPAPIGTVTVALGSESLTFWPWTGGSFDGTPSDPVNLVFVGQADPVALRAALMGLDGNRVVFGFPDEYPFNATWTDASGDVQTSWAAEGGWLGSVVQLQLGDYNPIRVHLRLFGVQAPFGLDGQWTLGAAHFEVMIPGTADHQVLSWELAEQLVLVDFLRSGLLDPALPMIPTGPINQAPSFRTIPATIYNLLPAALVAALGGPPQPVSMDVPLPSDGQGMVLNLAQAAPVTPGTTRWTQRFEYGQVVPKPICATGPYDYVRVEGPVDFVKSVTVSGPGQLSFDARYSGELAITPIDVTQDPPVPVGPTYRARVSEMQTGWINPLGFQALVQGKKLSHPGGGVEFEKIRLMVRATGRCDFSRSTHCLVP